MNISRRASFVVAGLAAVGIASPAAACPPPKYRIDDLVELNSGARLWVVNISKYKPQFNYLYGLALTKGGNEVTAVKEAEIKRKVN